MDNESWIALKAQLLAIGTATISGQSVSGYLTTSSAGPGAGGNGSVFFAIDSHRVRLSVAEQSPVHILHLGDGVAVLSLSGDTFTGALEKPALHCPRQAYITITGSCIYSCLYCNVPSLHGRRKTPDDVESLVASVYGDIDAISLTSGVRESLEEEVAYTLTVISRLTRFNLPIGVSIYPTPQTPALLKDAGVVEVKFNLEAATPSLAEKMCPGLPLSSLRAILCDAVAIFGRNHVFSNIILGLGETDAEMQACIVSLCQDGVIPVIRPLNPTADLREYVRPNADQISRTFRFLSQTLKAHDLDPAHALTMCPACMGCDMIPGRE
jgi:biotin synthase-related radical SAM superfamily protein